MTRHGTLAYYLAAWVIGCFIVSLLIWSFQVFAGGGPAAASVLLATYFFALIFGAADALLFAFLLRRLMRWWGAQQLWIWLLTGAGVSLLLILLLAKAGQAWLDSGVSGGPLLGLALKAILLAPNALRQANLWQVPIAGGSTAAVLCLVHRAFEHPDAAAPAPLDAARQAR